MMPPSTHSRKTRCCCALIKLLVASSLWAFAAGASDEQDGAKAAAAAPELGPLNEFPLGTNLDSLLSTNLIHRQPKPKADQPSKNYQQELDAARQLRRS